MASALISAIAQHDLDGVARLLAQGADPNIADPDGWLPLHSAIREVGAGAPIELVKLLLGHRANVNQPLRRVRGAAWDVLDNDTPLLRACDPPNVAVARVLLDAGADPNARRGDGESPLRLSVQAEDLEMAELLLRHGAAETINEYGGGNGLGLTALAYAASDFNIPMIELLLARAPTRKDARSSARVRATICRPVKTTTPRPGTA